MAININPKMKLTSNAVQIILANTHEWTVI